jgi:nitroimidazol reductase NimA-like FMN-containing flavoprotein (pyridoxamine 5'-phosphate oxidase superfamily)
MEDPVSLAMGELDAAQARSLLEHHGLARLTCFGVEGRSSLPIRYTISDRDHICAHTAEDVYTRPLAANTSIRLEVDDVDGPTRWSTVIGWGFVEGTAVPCCGPGTYNIRLTALRGFYRGGDPTTLS